jgi:hypothetical protein
MVGIIGIIFLKSKHSQSTALPVTALPFLFKPFNW